MTELPRHDAGDPDRQVWEQGWGDHEQRQLERLARLPLPEKLAWLEQAHRLVRRMHRRDNRSAGTHERP